MVIIFYSPNDKILYIASETDVLKKINISDPNLINHIPNDDILYVQKGCLINKQQIHQWLNGSFSLNDDGESSSSEYTETANTISVRKNKKYIHPVHHGTVFLQDIKTDKYPNGIQLSGKWHFIDIDDIGQDVIDRSAHYRVALKNKKIEVVDQEYVNKHSSKGRYISPVEQELNKILIKDDRHGTAEKVAQTGGISDRDSHIVEINI